MHRSLLAAWLLTLTAFEARSAEPMATEKLAAALRELDANVVVFGPTTRPPLAGMLANHVAAGLRDANRRDRAAWNAVRSLPDWRRFRDQRIDALRTSLGRFPKPAVAPRPHVVRTVRGDGYDVDCLLFESRPGVVVTANLYRPRTPATSMPAIVVSHSHHQAKQTGARQTMAATWARAGCLVYVPDHLGHGERRQHAFRTAADFDRPFPPDRQDYSFRYDAGAQLHLIGESLMGWLAWDLSRGVDVLLQQPGIDPQRIVIVSEPAGGGDVAAVAAALDERFTGAMIDNFGGPEPEDAYPLPKDAEESFPYAGSGTWESTRNLRRSAADGFLPWTIVAATAPRRLIYYHEFYWDRDRDPVWRRLRQVYDWHDAADSLAGIAGRGFVVGQPPANTHWIPASRELLYPTLERWFRIPSPGREYDRTLPEEDLLCLTTKPPAQLVPTPLHVVCRTLAQKRIAAARREREAMSVAERRARLRDDWSKRLGDVAATEELSVLRVDRERHDGFAIERIQLSTEPGIVVPVLLLTPHTEIASARTVVVGVAQEGKQRFLKERAKDVAALLARGATVCLCDVRGTGETDPGGPRGRNGAAAGIAASQLMLGQTAVGERLRDLRQVLRFLRDRAESKNARFAIWGEGFAPTNMPERRFDVPHGIDDRPVESEPLGAMLALLVTLFEDDVEAVQVQGGLTAYEDVLRSPFCYVPADAIVPGVFETGDLTDVVATLVPRRVRLAGLVDGWNRRASRDDVRRNYSIAVAAYRDAGTAEHLALDDDGGSVADWLLGVAAAE